MAYEIVEDGLLIIKVKGYLTYRDVIGEREFKLPDDVPVLLIDFLRDLAEEIDGEPGRALFDQELNTVGPSIAVMHNGRHYNHLPDRLETILQHNQGANPDDFDYRFNLDYGKKYTTYDPLISTIRHILDEETEQRAREVEGLK